VDVDAATQRGIVVMNTPGGNTISTAEHTFSMMMALARNIPQAQASMKEAKWDRKSFQGVELYNKTLGIIGLGRIGSEVARRAIAFGMRVLAYDPYLSLARAKSLQVEVVELNELFERADWITAHMPLSDETQGMIGRDAFARMKKGVRILNCARGGIVDEAALAEALSSGKVGGAARTGDDDLDPALHRGPGVLRHEVRSTVGRNDPHLVRDAQLLEHVHRVLHRLQVGLTAHDDAHEGSGHGSLQQLVAFRARDSGAPDSDPTSKVPVSRPPAADRPRRKVKRWQAGPRSVSPKLLAYRAPARPDAQPASFSYAPQWP